MATYNKKLKTLVVHQMLDGATVTIADTATDDKATRALNEFKRYETMHYEDSNGTHAIPYHAVQYIEVSETDGSVTRPDPYGCDEDVEIVTITFVTPAGDAWSADNPSSYEIRQMETANPMTVEKGTTITLPLACDGVAGVWYENSSEGAEHNGGTEFTVNANVILGADPCE